jgi:twinkle protein
MKIATSKGIIEITVPTEKANADGEVIIVCPICTPGRKSEHQKERKLSVNVNKSPTPWRCNHCGEGGFILTDDYVKRLKIKPILVNYNFMNVSDSLISWIWETRKIGIETLRKLNITMSDESLIQRRVSPEHQDWLNQYITRKCINFKYIVDGTLVNVKFRDKNKNFKLVSKATIVPYNIDSVIGKTECIITEGEFDTAAYIEAGITELGIISVPNGVTISDEERKIYEETGEVKVLSNINLDYLDLVISKLEHIEMFYLATDDDPPGIKLREELARRLGYERCKYIKFGEYKNLKGNPINDPNELLIEQGKAVLYGTLQNAHSFPIADVSTADEHLDELLKCYMSGEEKGISSGYEILNPYFNWIRGWFYVFNGYMNMGKTSVVLNLIAITAVKYQWKWGIYCPENYPVRNVVKIFVEILLGRTTESGFKNRISPSEITDIVNTFIKKYFFFVNNEDGYTPEQLRKIKKQLIKQNGIVGFLTDPWSNLNHHYGNNIDEYLERELSQETRLTKKYNIINAICHHPKTVDQKTDMSIPPTVHNLTGGKYWGIKCDVAVTIHQENYEDWNNNIIGLHVQKVKDKQRAGETTTRTSYPRLRYDKLSRRLYEPDDLKKEKLIFNKFPFENFMEIEQQSLFDGF